MAKKDNNSRGRNSGGSSSNNQRNQSSASSSKKPSASSGGGKRSSSSGEGLDDLTYNVITVLHEKSKGLEAYEQYLEDASDNEEVRQIFEELRDQDLEAVGRLEQCLQTLISGGEFESEEGDEEEDVA
jgi:hypothetical protein